MHSHDCVNGIEMMRDGGSKKRLHGCNASIIR